MALCECSAARAQPELAPLILSPAYQSLGGSRMILPISLFSSTS